MLPPTDEHQVELAIFIVVLVIGFGVGFWLGGKR